MKEAAIISHRLDSQWTDGWAVLNGLSAFALPAVWLIDSLGAQHRLGGVIRGIVPAHDLKRAARFQQPMHAWRFEVTNAVLRLLLAKVTGTSAQTLTFRPGYHGKPELDDVHEGIFFNVSYSEQFSLIAIDRRPVGVDIEWLGRPLVIHDMLDASFSDTEIKFINASQDETLHRFFTLWTRKEAVLKLTGEGIGEHLPQFSVLDGVCSTEKRMIGKDVPDTIWLYTFAAGDRFLGSFATDRQEPVPAFYKL